MSNLLQWLFGGGLVLVTGLFAAILRATYKLGADAKEIKDGLVRITKLEEHFNQVPILMLRIGQVEKALQDYRSDIRELLRERRGSRPDNDNEE